MMPSVKGPEPVAAVSSRRGAEDGSTAPADFESFFQHEHGRLVRALLLLTGNPTEAEDLAQETMIRIYERWDRVSKMASPVGYAYRTALNLFRKGARWLRVRASSAVLPSPIPGPEATAQLRQDVFAALRALPRAQREALIVVEWLGLRVRGGRPHPGHQGELRQRPTEPSQSLPSTTTGRTR